MTVGMLARQHSSVVYEKKLVDQLAVSVCVRRVVIGRQRNTRFTALFRTPKVGLFIGCTASGMKVSITEIRRLPSVSGDQVTLHCLSEYHCKSEASIVFVTLCPPSAVLVLQLSETINMSHTLHCCR